MARDIQPLGYFELVYPLMQKAVAERQSGANQRSGVRQVVREAGIDLGSGYRAVNRWYEARVQEKSGKLVRRKLPDKYAVILLAFFAAKFPEELRELEADVKKWEIENCDPDDGRAFADACKSWGENRWAWWREEVARKKAGADKLGVGNI